MDVRHEPELFRQTNIFADVHSYLAWRFTGLFRTSWASADPLGLFDLEHKAWSLNINALKLPLHQLPELQPPATSSAK